MAISFGGTGQYLRRTTNLPPATAWTLAGWFRVRSVRASQYQYFIDLDDGNNYAVVGYQAAGGWDIGTSGGAATNPTGPAINTWTYIACTLAGAGANNFRVYHATPYASAFVVATSAGASFTPTEMYVGTTNADEWCNVDAANIMVWSAVLTEYELWRQMRSARPLRWQNLNLWSPLRTLADVGDYSGNGNHWSVGGTLAGVDGPPLAWQRAWFVPFAVGGAAGVTGNGAATLGGLTATAVGSVSVNAAGAASVGGINAAGSASLGSLPGVSGAGSAVVGAVVAAGAGSVGVNGAGSATLRVTTAGAASAGVNGTGTAVLGAVQATGKAYRLVGATVGGVVTASGRYFATSSTGALVLAGFHTWADISDTGSSYPPSAFDWPAYLAALVSAGGNYTKLWMMESARDWGDASPLYFAPIPWARTGPGNAADGRLKFDLTKYDNTYFERMRERAILAGNAGVYVCVQLFQGWHIESKGLAYNPWLYHPFNAANNINGVNGDANADGKGLETRLATSTAIYNLQKAYVDQVIATVGDLDNVIYEISNEDHNDSWDWQVALMGYIRTVESGRAKQHLVGLTVCWPTTNNSQLAASSADWVSYADTDTTPDANTSGPVSAYDTDHNPNLFTTGRGWVWRALTRGHGGLWLMDEWAGETYGHDTRADSAWNVQRVNLGHARAYAARLDLANATAQGGLSSTGYCLAKTSGRYQLLAYQDSSGAFTVNLTGLAGTYTLEWLRPATGATQAGSNVTGGAVRTLTPPWSGEDAVALLELAGYNANGAATLAGIAATGAASVAVNAAGAAALGALTAVAAGTVAVAGAGSAAVGAIVAAGAGVVAVGGTGQAALGAIVAAAVGSVGVAGAGAAQVGGVVAVGAAVVAVNATGAGTVGALTASGYGAVGAVVVVGNGGAVLGAIAATGAASVAVQAAGAAAVGALAATGAAVVAVNAAGQATVGAIVAAGYGNVGAGAAGNGGALLGDLVAAGVGSVAVSGAGAVTVGGHVSAGAASVVVNAAGAAQVGAVAASGAASVQVTGSGAATLGAIAASGSGALSALPEIQGYGAATIGGIIAVGTAVVAWVAVMGRVSGPGGRGAVSGPGVKAKV